MQTSTVSHAQTQLFTTAESCLLAPYDLGAGRLDKVFGSIMAHRIDYADLYFQYVRSEGWSLEEGIVKSGSFNIEQGVGVRAVPPKRLPLPSPTTSALSRWKMRRVPRARLPNAAM